MGGYLCVYKDSKAFSNLITCVPVHLAADLETTHSALGHVESISEV